MRLASAIGICHRAVARQIDSSAVCTMARSSAPRPRVTRTLNFSSQMS